MPRFLKKRSRKIGLPPGTLIYVGEKKAEKTAITIFDYDAEEHREKHEAKVEDCVVFKDQPSVTWINVDGLHEVSVLEQLGQVFGLHPLVLEDILHTDQRPKAEDYADHVYVVLKMFHYNNHSGDLQSEQISLILGSNFLLSFQEKKGDVFDPIRERIRSGKGRVRKMGADYLAYTLLDAVVDSYFMILEDIETKVEEIEDELIDSPAAETLQKIYELKRDILGFRRAVWPLRDLVGSLEREDSPLFRENTGLYLRDLYDHTIQVMDVVETLREMLAGMLDIYLSSMSNRMNAVMKVLTIIATIFIPLTFVAGIYGMNFEYMPELTWHWGYPAVWVAMLGILVVMLIYFRRKEWF